MSGGRWLERPEREEKINLLKEKLKKIAALVKAKKASQYHIDMLKRDKEELEKLMRVHRAEIDHVYFFYEYFSEARNPGNPDNLVPTSDVDIAQAPEFHKKLSRVLDSVSNYNTTANVCWSASRGHAKSAYLSNSFPTREICFRKRKMILVISESQAGSMKFIKWCSGQLKYNDKLRNDFGNLLYDNSNLNIKDSQEMFITTSGSMMASGSLGKQIRGIRNGSVRPDLIILDDLESKESNNTAELRQKNRDWFNMEMYPARDVAKCATVFMGTMTHPESLLAYVLDERTDFIKNKFPAIIDYPERMDLWEKFEDTFKNYVPTEEELDAFENATEKMETPNERAAMDFYREHKDDMDKGSKVLWPSRFPLAKLFMEKVSIGSHAFSTEFQNIPYDKSEMLFDPDKFATFDPSLMNFMTNEYQIGLSIDPALGKERGDYSAIIVIAKHKKTGKFYVVDSYGKRIKPEQFIEEVVEKVLKWQPHIVAVESVAFQEFFATSLKTRLQAAGYPAFVRVKQIYNKQRKQLRIEALHPEIENGTIVFNPNHKLLLQQFEQYGLGHGAKSSTHDDLPDALQMCIQALKTHTVRVIKKTNWRM